jgi:sec-independent protein translocase protein TatA
LITALPPLNLTAVPVLLPTPFLAFFNVGGPELVMITLLALMLFGGKKLPELARGFGKAMREFRQAASGVEQEIKRAMEEEPPTKPPPVQPPKPPAEK